MAYISPWLTHFVGQQHPTNYSRSCDILLKILRDGTLGQWERQGSMFIDPGSKIFGAGSLCKNEFIRFRPVCFCDIPAEHLERHAKVYGPFGLAFEKGFLVKKGANPVFYIAKGSLASFERPPVPPLTIEAIENDADAALRKYFAAVTAERVAMRRCEFFDHLVADLMKVLPPRWPPGTPGDAYDPVRDVQRQLLTDLLSHVFAFMKFFDESLPEDNRENFYMEREWRVAGFVRFELSDVKQVYVAPGFRDRVEREFSGLRLQELAF